MSGVTHLTTDVCMNAKMQTPLNPEFRLATDKGFKGARQRGYWARSTQYSDLQSRLPSFSQAKWDRGHERRRP